LEYRDIIIQTYVSALRMVFALTVGFVLLNMIAGAFLEEYTLHDNLERRLEAESVETETVSA
jgi:hypothetical protein